MLSCLKIIYCKGLRPCISHCAHNNLQVKFNKKCDLIKKCQLFFRLSQKNGQNIRNFTLGLLHKQALIS